MQGVSQIEVTFDIDANGIVKVSAKDLGTGKAQEITITSSSNMSESDIQKAMAEAARFEAEDNARREAQKTVNEAQTVAYKVEMALHDKEKSSLIDKEKKTQIKAALHDLQSVLKKQRPGKEDPSLTSEIMRKKSDLEQIAADILE